MDIVEFTTKLWAPTDVCSRCVFSDLSKTRTENSDNLADLVVAGENFTGNSVKTICTDGACEYTHTFKKFAVKKGIQLQHSFFFFFETNFIQLVVLNLSHLNYIKLCLFLTSNEK